jgi:hypothetical protein
MHMWGGAWRRHRLCSCQATTVCHSLILLSLRRQPPRKSPETRAYAFSQLGFSPAGLQVGQQLLLQAARACWGELGTHTYIYTYTYQGGTHSGANGVSIAIGYTYTLQLKVIVEAWVMVSVVIGQSYFTATGK